MSDEEEEHVYTCETCGNKYSAPCSCFSCPICEMADEVIRDGKYGTGEERRRNLGDDYIPVQNEINRRYGYSKRY